MSEAQYYDGKGWFDGFTNAGDEFGENYDYDMVEEIIKEVCGDYADVEVQNFGWRNLSGSTTISTKNALSKIIPNCFCNFKMRVDGKRIQLDVSHHDSPVGGEIYTITKCLTRTEV